MLRGDEFEQGATLGKYEIIKKIAVGGMAQIYLARVRGTAGFEKLVVLKRILPSVAEDASFVEMFLDEARLAATLRHPNIADVFDVGAEDNSYYFAMEFIHGQDARTIRLAAYELDRDIPIEIALAIVSGTAYALAYAHAKTGPNGPLGIVHRDITPSNILVSYDGAVKLVDFGIARADSRTNSVKTRTGTLKGKVPYMSPEQCKGKKLDHRSDLFSLGTVLYELTTGQRPFEGHSEYDTLEMIVHGRLQPPSRLVPAYPSELEGIVMRLLALDPAARYQDADSVLLDLEKLTSDAGLLVSERVVARYMRELFAEEIAEWENAGGHPTVQTKLPTGFADIATGSGELNPFSSSPLREPAGPTTPYGAPVVRSGLSLDLDESSRTSQHPFDSSREYRPPSLEPPTVEVKVDETGEPMHGLLVTPDIQVFVRTSRSTNPPPMGGRAPTLPPTSGSDPITTRPADARSRPPTPSHVPARSRPPTPSHVPTPARAPTPSHLPSPTPSYAPTSRAATPSQVSNPTPRAPTPSYTSSPTPSRAPTPPHAPTPSHTQSPTPSHAPTPRAPTPSHTPSPTPSRAPTPPHAPTPHAATQVPNPTPTRAPTRAPTPSQSPTSSSQTPRTLTPTQPPPTTSAATRAATLAAPSRATSPPPLVSRTASVTQPSLRPPTRPPETRAPDFTEETPPPLPSPLDFAEEEVATTKATRDDVRRAIASTRNAEDVTLRDDTTTQRKKAFATQPDRTRLDGVLRSDPMITRGDDLLDEVDVGAPRDETDADRALRRVTELCARCAAWLRAGDFDQAVVAAELALEEPTTDERVQRTLGRERATLLVAFESFLGDPGRAVLLARPLDELADLKLDQRAAFLLSRIDGEATVEELLDMSGMSRFEASRHLCRLVLRKMIVVG